METPEQRLEHAIHLLEINIQQQSGHQSDVLSRVISLEDNVNAFKKEMTSFKEDMKPIADAFKDTATKKMVMGKFGIEMKDTAIWVTTIIAALTALGIALRWIFKQLI